MDNTTPMRAKEYDAKIENTIPFYSEFYRQTIGKSAPFGAGKVSCMKIIAFIEEEDTIRQILKHLGLWLPGNHDPPEQKTYPTGTQIFNIIEMDFDTSLQAIREEIIPQMPYEDDYSQITPYDDECIGL